MSGPILIGESNPYGADPYFAMYPEPRNSAGGRMQRLVLGIKAATYIELERYNLCEGRWSVPAARAEAKRLADLHLRGASLFEEEAPGHPVFLLLGRKVATAFGFSQAPAFRTIETLGNNVRRCGTFVLLPHPSGRNRMWLDPTTVQRCREVLGPLCPELTLGEVDV